MRVPYTGHFQKFYIIFQIIKSSVIILLWISF